jgi:hypothetical protein
VLGFLEQNLMSDDQLIAEVAKLWMDNGGDAEGLAWCYEKLRDAIIAETEKRQTHAGE